MGDVENNIKRAEAILDEGNPKDLDLLILPEMAFSGKFGCESVTFSTRRLDALS